MNSAISGRGRSQHGGDQKVDRVGRRDPARQAIDQHGDPVHLRHDLPAEGG